MYYYIDTPMKKIKRKKSDYQKPVFIKKKRYLLLKRNGWQNYSIADFMASEDSP